MILVTWQWELSKFSTVYDDFECEYNKFSTVHVDFGHLSKINVNS